MTQTFWKPGTSGFSLPTAGRARRWAVVDAWMHILSASLPSLWIYSKYAKHEDSLQATILKTYCTLSEIQENVAEYHYKLNYILEIICNICYKAFFHLKFMNLKVGYDFYKWLIQLISVYSNINIRADVMLY